MAFRRPVERGYLVNWEGQSEIWEHEFFEGKAPLEVWSPALLEDQ